MKKLMILGGSKYIIPLIKKAHDLGIYVITCDYLPNNYAHKYSDEYCNVSVIEKDRVLDKAKELKINGITSFACDAGVVTAAYVAEKMGLPSCGPYKSVCILQNKGSFRKFLSDNGFNVPMARSFTSVEEAKNIVNIFNWPVIVKPTDSAGSKGVSKVESVKELDAAVDNALKYSHNNEFIIEDYITQHGFASDSDSFSVDGELKFISFSSQRFDLKANNPYTPAAYSWPSSMSKEHQRELKHEIQRLLTLLGMKTSIYNIESREGTDGKAYIMECSPRGGGNRLAECLEYATGVNLIENVIRAALGMELVEINQKEYNGHWAEIILHSDEVGTFSSLWIDDSIKTSVYEKDLWVNPGDKVGSFMAANESIGTLVLQFDNDKRLNEVMKNQDKYVKVMLVN